MFSGYHNNKIVFLWSNFFSMTYKDLNGIFTFYFNEFALNVTIWCQICFSLAVLRQVLSHCRFSRFFNDDIHSLC